MSKFQPLREALLGYRNHGEFCSLPRWERIYCWLPPARYTQWKWQIHDATMYQNVVCICCNFAEQAVLRPAHLPPQLQPPGKILVVPGLGLKDSGSSEGFFCGLFVGCRTRFDKYITVGSLSSFPTESTYILKPHQQKQKKGWASWAHQVLLLFWWERIQSRCSWHSLGRFGLYRSILWLHQAGLIYIMPTWVVSIMNR